MYSLHIVRRMSVRGRSK